MSRASALLAIGLLLGLGGCTTTTTTVSTVPGLAPPPAAFNRHVPPSP